MSKETSIKLFETKKIRTFWDSEKEKWYFSIVDVIEVLTESTNPPAYWRKLKERLKAEGNETVTNCHALKMIAADGKMRLTDVADTEQLLRLIQSIPSPKAEPLKMWLAMVGYERIEETEISKENDPKTFEDSRVIAKQGGTIAGNTRKAIEEKTHKKIVTKSNAKKILNK